MRTLSRVLVSLWAIGSTLALAGESLTAPFVEDFGADAADRWVAMTGDWRLDADGYRQTSEEFDCGLGLELRPDQPYWLSVRFTPESPFVGGGLLFGLPQPTNKAGGTLVRCDPGGTVMWGEFSSNGEFAYRGSARTGDADGAQELAVAVDPAKLAFNIYHNGKRIATNAKSYNVEGCVGIQSSGGAHLFTRFEVRPATEAELTGIEAGGPYSRIVGLIGDKQRLVAVRRERFVLTEYDRNGAPRRNLRAEEIADGDLRPVAACWESSANGRPGMLLLAEGGAAIYRIDADLKPTGDGPLARIADMRGADIAVGQDGTIFVADPSIPGLRVLSPDGAERLKYGEKGSNVNYGAPSAAAAGRFTAPAGVAVAPDGSIVVTDRENSTYYVYRYDADANTFEWVTNGPWLPHPEGVQVAQDGQLLLASQYEYYGPYGALRVLSLDGQALNSFTGHSIGLMSERVRACEGPGGRFYIADADKDRIVVLPSDFSEQLPQFEWLPNGDVKLTMTDVAGEKIVGVGKASSAADGRVIVRQEKAICESWPPIKPAELATYELPLKPPAGKTYVIDMPVLVAVFTTVTDDKGEKKTVAPDGIAERLRRELDVDRHFYWLNSWGVLNKTFEIMIIDEIEPENVGAWIPPEQGRKLVNQVRVRRGLPPIGSSDSLVVIHAGQAYDPDFTDDMGFVGGGGLTPFAYSGYMLWNHGQGWLMAHEWGHQLDNYFDHSGVPEWWLNHPDATVHIGRFGEHWDCNAFLCRRADKMNWLRFKFGTLRLVDDNDGDGLADNDPTLPLDERRFGSSASQADTDGDGLNDLQEMTAGTFTSSNPTSSDTDGDGLPDAKDVYPQYAVRTTLPAYAGAAAAVSAFLAGDGPAPADPLGAIQRSWADAQMWAYYDADHVYLLTRLNKPATNVIATIDFNDDGWFAGRDNLGARVSLDLSDPAAPKANGSQCEVQVGAVDGGQAVLMTIKRPDGARPLAPGRKLGAALRVENGAGTIQFLIDPWQLLELTAE